jgi:hypothetical protein
MNDLEVNTNQKIGVQFQTANFPIGFKVKDIVTFFRKIYCVNHNSDELFFLFEIDKL